MAKAKTTAIQATEPLHKAARQDARTREEIVEAAARAFMTRGYHGASLDVVAKELGCTKGPIYYKYKSKADLFFDVQREAMRMNIATVQPEADAQGPAYARLSRMVEQQALLIMTHLPYQRVLLQGVEMHLEGSTTAAQREVLDELIRTRDVFEGFFVAVVDEGVKKKEYPKVDPRIFVKVLLGSLTWLTTWYRPQVGETAAQRTKLAREVTRYMLHGLTIP